MTSKQRLENFLKRIDKLDAKGIKVYLDMITDRVDTDLYFRIQAVDRLGNILEEETFTDIPKDYIDRYSDKYNIVASVRVYDKINNDLIERSV